jgi:excisionase family DNA binding protein
MAKLLRAVEVAEQLGLTTSTIRQMISRGELPAVRPTRRAVRVPADAVEAISRLGYEGYAATRRRRASKPNASEPIAAAS